MPTAYHIARLNTVGLYGAAGDPNRSVRLGEATPTNYTWGSATATGSSVTLIQREDFNRAALFMIFIRSANTLLTNRTFTFRDQTQPSRQATVTIGGLLNPSITLNDNNVDPTLFQMRLINSRWNTNGDGVARAYLLLYTRQPAVTFQAGAAYANSTVIYAQAPLVEFTRPIPGPSHNRYLISPLGTRLPYRRFTNAANVAVLNSYGFFPPLFITLTTAGSFEIQMSPGAIVDGGTNLGNDRYRLSTGDNNYDSLLVRNGSVVSLNYNQGDVVFYPAERYAAPIDRPRPGSGGGVVTTNGSAILPQAPTAPAASLSYNTITIAGRTLTVGPGLPRPA